MRGIGHHIAPAETLPEPADNTSRYVDEQVAECQRTGIPVHPEVAREIAARYSSPAIRDLPFGMFATTGKLSQRCCDPGQEWTRVERERPLILDAIEREMGGPDNMTPEVADLWALRYYVQHACVAAGWAY
ncbi:hypothetical protein [Micromonospora maritima]|uniref:hypothetical protein n=1 Tax=Micromonospora maritima TaxID=986711 RepID=UPI00157DF7AA|nr:hypothetical protein [Micromonospora maritima]